MRLGARVELASSALVLFGCVAARREPARAVPTTLHEQASVIYRMRCTPCHGSTGRGDGPAASALNPRPRDDSSPAWQASMSDADIERIILVGGASLGRSPLMPPNPDLAAKPEVVAALRMIIRDVAAPRDRLQRPKLGR